MIAPKKLGLYEYIFGKIYRFMNRYIWRLFLSVRLRKYFLEQKKDGDWWEREYINQFQHHSFQNKIISSDFIKFARQDNYFSHLFEKSSSFAELGSGTGELSYFLSNRYTFKKVTGFEVSETAVGIANKLYGSGKLKFNVIHPTDQLDIYDSFDFVICSNTLEHFKDPFPIINKAFNLSSILIIIVPYNQPVSIDYSYEGGPDHVFCFTENTFVDYQILGGFLFRTGGWQVSSAGEEPLEMAIAISKK